MRNRQPTCEAYKAEAILIMPDFRRSLPASSSGSDCRAASDKDRHRMLQAFCLIRRYAESKLPSGSLGKLRGSITIPPAESTAANLSERRSLL
jgi:hypothetical protein